MRRQVRNRFIAAAIILAIGYVLYKLFSGPSTSRRYVGEPKKLVVIVIDGFRWDFVERMQDELPTFMKLKHEGTTAGWLEPIFPSVSYPSWMTLLTGLYTESHGVIGDFMYDQFLHLTFDRNNDSTTGNRAWWGAEPVWATALKNDLRVSVIQLGRCDIKFDGRSPHYCDSFSENGFAIGLKLNLGMAASLLHCNDFIMVYGQHIEAAGQQFGPNSPQLKQAVRDYDRIIGEFLDELYYQGLKYETNIIVVSCFGMTPTGRVVELADHINMDDISKLMDEGTHIAIFLKHGANHARITEQLGNIPGVLMYTSKTIPQCLHYRGNRKVPDLLLMAEKGYYIRTGHNANSFLRKYPKCDNYRYSHQGKPRGASGHAGEKYPDMRGIFYAYGPDFKRNHQVPKVRLPDIYNVMTRALNITGLPNNGSCYLNNIFVDD